jgi:hypothetical protein
MTENTPDSHTEWKKYDNEREYKTTAELLVIRPIESDFTPIFCPTCKFPMQTADDFFSYKDKKACFKCVIHLKKRSAENKKLLDEIMLNTYGIFPSDGSHCFHEDEYYLSMRRKTFKPVIRFK